MVDIGKRVGALLLADDDEKVVKLLGFGVLIGCEVPDDSAMGVSDGVRENGRSNPKIKLDNGKIVWGAECWWGDEEDIKSDLKGYVNAGYKIIDVDIDRERERQIRWRLQEIDEHDPKCSGEDDAECDSEVTRYLILGFPFPPATVPLCENHYQKLVKDLENHPYGIDAMINVMTPDDFIEQLKVEKVQLLEKLKKYEKASI